MTTQRKYGRKWALIMTLIILVLPLITLYFMKKGFEFRWNTPESENVLTDSTILFPDYSFISHRGDTISRARMLNKVCVIDFLSHSCGKSIDAKQRRLFELQEDYYGKTTEFRILSMTLKPEEDSLHQVRLMSERYAGREMWHFLRGDDSTSRMLLQFCRKKTNNVEDTDPFCPQFVYLVDGQGRLRGKYDPTNEDDFDNLYNDILFFIDKLDVQEEN